MESKLPPLPSNKPAKPEAKKKRWCPTIFEVSGAVAILLLAAILIGSIVYVFIVYDQPAHIAFVTRKVVIGAVVCLFPVVILLSLIGLCGIRRNRWIVTTGLATMGLVLAPIVSFLAMMPHLWPLHPQTEEYIEGYTVADVQVEAKLRDYVKERASHLPMRLSDNIVLIAVKKGEGRVIVWKYIYRKSAQYIPVAISLTLQPLLQAMFQANDNMQSARTDRVTYIHRFFDEAGWPLEQFQVGYGAPDVINEAGNEVFQTMAAEALMLSAASPVKIDENVSMVSMEIGQDASLTYQLVVTNPNLAKRVAVSREFGSLLETYGNSGTRDLYRKHGIARRFRFESPSGELLDVLTDKSTGESSVDLDNSSAAPRGATAKES